MFGLPAKKRAGTTSSSYVGTIFDKTRTPLRVWFSAAWYVTNQKNGVSALGLQRVLGLGSYETAWTMLHRLRRAMVRPGREKLHGLVGVDTENLIAFVREVVEPGSTVHTDGHNGYLTLPDYGYVHQRTVHTSSPQAEHVTMPGVHRVAALLKRWMMGTHQGAIRDKQIDTYLDEFVFRFNRRTSRSRGLLFYRLMQQAVVTTPVTYHDIAMHNPLNNRELKG